MLKLRSDKYDICILNEPTYNLRSVDNVYTYEHEYVLSRENHFNSSHGIKIVAEEEVLNSCVLVASGGSTGVHDRTAVIVRDYIYLAVGDALSCLKLPSLDLLWWQKVYFATCFGVYYLANEDCLITHGEIEISRFTRSGDLVWHGSGKDIFTEGFEIKDDIIEAIDFNHEKYRIRVSDGWMQLLSENIKGE
ncbi:MAG: hypothetical protein AAF614_23110 [Chloroflexota bacterium]